MLHNNKGRTLNVKPKHRKSLLRNQVIHFILHGKLCTTVARIKEVKRLVERVVTIARDGNHFNNRRKVYSLLPYNLKALDKLFNEIAGQYKERPGGYTRLVRLHNRLSDTADIGQLLWVSDKGIKKEKNNESSLLENQTTELDVKEENN